MNVAKLTSEEKSHINGLYAAFIESKSPSVAAELDCIFSQLQEAGFTHHEFTGECAFGLNNPVEISSKWGESLTW
jgi:hypothetical protein